MAKTTFVAVATVGDLLSNMTGQLVTDGWTAVGGASGVYVSTADPLGRVVYIKPFIDALSQLMVSIAPILNAGGTDLEPNFTHTKGCNFGVGDWDMYSDEDYCCINGSTIRDGEKLYFGRQDVDSRVSIEGAKWAGFIAGCRNEDSATANGIILLGQGVHQLYVLMSGGGQYWVQGGIGVLNMWNAGLTTFTWKPDTGWLDGKLACMRPVLTANGAGEIPENRGILGRMPGMLNVAKDIDLVIGDTVTLENGEVYEFREHTLYWDEYVESFLLWRTN